MDEIERQQKLVSWAYTIQWSCMLMPPAVLVSLLFLLSIRKRISNPGLRSHVEWQLATCGIAALLIVAAILLFIVGMSGINSDSIVSVIATFACMGISAIFIPWFVYRLVRGTLYFSREDAMTSLLF